MSECEDLPAALQALIERLELSPHPEGGWYRETHRSDVVLPPEVLPVPVGASRSLMTSILFLLPAEVQTAWHRFRSEELWIHQQGDAVELKMNAGVRGAADMISHVGPRSGEVPQALVPSDWWQTARVMPGEHGFALVACVVAPGFDFRDFELAAESSDWSP